MYNPGHHDEYYILQNVQKKGWDLYAESKGLMIMHVDYDKDIWQQDVVNNTTVAPAMHHIPRRQLAVVIFHLWRPVPL